MTFFLILKSVSFDPEAHWLNLFARKWWTKSMLYQKLNILNQKITLFSNYLVLLIFVSKVTHVNKGNIFHFDKIQTHLIKQTSIDFWFRFKRLNSTENPSRNMYTFIYLNVSEFRRFINFNVLFVKMIYF